MKIAVMQPYLFPYIGYFQMIRAVDKFILYDDVNYIKGGWINRNRILVNGEAKYFNIILNGASSFKQINEILINTKSIQKILKTIKQSYSKAPYFISTFQLIEDFFLTLENEQPISKVAGDSIQKVLKYIGLNTEIEYSSKDYSDTKGLDKADRLIEILKRNNSNIYINVLSGRKLYSKDYFKKNGIELNFIQNHITSYNQNVSNLLKVFL
jgi:hypothetical protein